MVKCVSVNRRRKKPLKLSGSGPCIFAIAEKTTEVKSSVEDVHAMKEVTLHLEMTN